MLFFLFAEVIVDDRALVCDWRDILSKKYSKLPAIQKLHDFIYVKNPVTSEVVGKVHELCHTGSLSTSFLHETASYSPAECLCPTES